MRAFTIGDVAMLAPKLASTPPTPASTTAVWWAGDLAVADAAAVSSWVDRVNGVTVMQGTEAAQPVMDVDGANGRPSVNFDGGDWLGLSSSLSAASSGCVVAVARIADPLQGQTVWSHGGPNTNRYLVGTTRFNSVGEIESQQRDNDTNDIVRGNSAVPSNTLAILEWGSTGSAYVHRLNNLTQTMTASQGANTGDWFDNVQLADRWTIGALRYSPPIGLLGGRIAYLGVFAAPLTTDDRAALYAWLAAHYGIG